MSITRLFEEKIDTFSSRVSSHSIQFVLLVLLLLTVVIGARSADPDLFARVAMGRLIVKFNEVPALDPFAYTSKKEFWIDHEWLSGLVFYGLTQLGGDFALQLGKLMFALGSIWFLLLAQRVHSAQARYSLFWAVVCLLNSAYIWTSTIRSQVFTYLFFPYLLFALVVYEQSGRKRYLYSLPLIFAFWANAHGGFVSGLGVLGVAALLALFFGKRSSAPIFIALLFSFCATALNPYGLISYWSYILDAVTMPRPSITEWQPVRLGDLGFILSHFIVAVILIALVLKRGASVASLGLLALTAFFAYRHARFTALLSMTAFVYGAPFWEGLVESFRQRFLGQFLKLRRALTTVVLGWGVFGLYLAIKFAFTLSSFSLDYGAYPVFALEWLRERGVGNKLLVDFNNGSYALWRLYPKFQISIDGRYEEVYPQETETVVSRAMNVADPGQPEALMKVWPDYILLRVDSASFSNRHKFGPEWSLVYKDEKFGLLGQTESSSEVASAPETIRPCWNPLF